MKDTDPRSVTDVYDRHGAAWAALRNREEAGNVWVDRFCRLLPFGSAVLDVGCGSGVPIASDLIRRGYAVTGIDASETRVSLARKNLPGIRIELLDMRSMDLGLRFDGVLAWDSFFHLSPADQRGMFDRFANHAAPGALLMFTSGTREGTAIGMLEGASLYHGSLSTAEYRELLASSGSAVVQHVEEDPTCGNRTVWLAKLGGWQTVASE